MASNLSNYNKTVLVWLDVATALEVIRVPALKGSKYMAKWLVKADDFLKNDIYLTLSLT